MATHPRILSRFSLAALSSAGISATAARSWYRRRGLPLHDPGALCAYLRSLPRAEAPPLLARFSLTKKPLTTLHAAPEGPKGTVPPGVGHVSW